MDGDDGSSLLAISAGMCKGGKDVVERGSKAGRPVSGATGAEVWTGGCIGCRAGGLLYGS